MTTPHLSCDQFADTLAEFLERDVSETTRAAMDAHALACGECGPLLADLRKLRIDAANLPELAPSRDLWSGIAERIETPVVNIGTGEHRVPVIRATRTRWLHTGLAAAGLVAVTAGVTYRITRRAVVSARIATTAAPAPIVVHDTVLASTLASAAPDSSNGAPAVEKAAAPGRTPSATATTRLVSNEVSPERTYDVEIARLRAIVDKRRSTLDTGTVRVIDQNLLIIDAAIAQCRAALAKDPRSRFLLQSLNDALDDKVQLLRTATTLPSAADY